MLYKDDTGKSAIEINRQATHVNQLKNHVFLKFKGKRVGLFAILHDLIDIYVG